MISFLIAGIWTIAFSPSVDPIVYRDVEKLSIRDTESDSSFQKFLDKNHFFANLQYEPNDLKPIESDFTANNSRKYKLREEVWIEFSDMARHFWNDFSWKRKLSITTAYRSYWEQKYLLWSYCRDKKGQCAEAWASEHQAGLALDIWVNGKSLDNLSIQWLQNNAYKRGFHNTYQKGLEIDGQIVEPWHRRYVWKDLAKELYEKNLSFAERYYIEK